MQLLNIAILGTRGIPNRYGGFEQVAEYLSAGLSGKGHKVIVYNSHHHPYKQEEWNGARIIHCFDAEKYIGTAGQFIYDLNCIRDVSKQDFDIILFLGYTSSSVWGKLFPKKAIIVSNMDGLEWKRSKYSGLVRKFLLYAEKLAVKYSDHLIADSIAIQAYLQKKYNIQSRYIPYGADIMEEAGEEILKFYGLVKGQYFMLMARMEPENNVDMILEGFCKTASESKFVVVGNVDNSFGKKMVSKYGADRRLLFCGAVFDKAKISALRKSAKLYFHGHSVGGTNPSLLEAMADGVLIAAHENEFNKTVLQDDAYYFGTAAEAERLIDEMNRSEKKTTMVEKNLQKIRDEFNWPAIVNRYEAMFMDCYNKKAK